MKTIRNIRLAFTMLVILAPLSGCAVLTNNPNATIRVRVVDEAGEPISGVSANVYNIYDMDTKPGLTDTNGMHSVHLYNIFHINGSFQKQGYYTSYGVFWKAPEWGKVPPANTNFTIVMRRIIDPVPMTQRVIRTYLPRNDEPVGFDLEVGDWVRPYGTGKIIDIQMTGKMRYASQVDREVTITADFPEKLCGIQSFVALKSSAHTPLRSELMPPYTAPDDGYEPMFSLWRIVDGAHNVKTHENKDQNYLFRARVVTNEKGEIIRANYGWTVGDIFTEAVKDNRIWLRFTYYYNPDPKSRSLEPKEIADRQAKDIPKGGEK